MNRHRLAFAAVLLLAAGTILPGTATMQTPQAIVFRNVTVIPMDSDRIVAAQAVVVRGSVIESVGPAASSHAPAGGMVIDGTGGFLVPGLTDMHVHLPGPTAPVGRADDELFLYVANGVTTARSMAGFDTHVRLRERINTGELIGPTLFLAGPGLDGERVKSPDEGEREVRQQKQRGYDLVKILPGLSLASYDAIVKTAREVGIPFAGHVPADVGIRHAIESGQETIEHLDGYLEYLKGREPVAADAMVPIVAQTKRAGVWNVPTMAVMVVNVGTIDSKELVVRPELQYIAKDYIDQWLALRARSHIPKQTSDVIQANRMHLLKALNDAGARILVGTDSPQLFNVPGFSIVREMQMMVAAGMTPYQVIRAGTEQTGEYFNRPCGTITAGACADLILLDANPLQDLRSFARKRGVMVRGRWIPEGDIKRQLEQIRSRPGNYRLTN
ncbi:MAG: amidohydrolase [Acidobacteria bacterium]|nr:MAG: amidohydrolase [Acidobacteriota bacterium]